MDNHEPTNKLGKIDFTMTSTNNKNSDDTYKAPELNPEQITPAIVRDELLKCFESANCAFGKIIMNQPSSRAHDQQLLKQQVRQL
jgi:hypothetical protein